ncbi:MAG: tyrosine--tRNA ligase [Candidatus Aenigmatarchaeota archaeon]
MDKEEIIKLVEKEPTEEILTKERLAQYLDEKRKINHYIGFEISGFVHLGTGIICMSKVADFQKAGINTTIFLADFHSWINKKLGGDLSTIKKVAGGYFKEALKISLKIVGGDPDKSKFVLGSDHYKEVGLEYFETVLKVSMNTNLSRIKRSLTIMGRKESDSIDFAQLIYPPMQVADIFSLKVNLAHGGMDQRKAHVIAIDVGEKVSGYKPIAVHHHLLIGMQIDEKIRENILSAKKEGKRELFEESIIDIKMSKSKPESAIFIHDSEEEIKRKISKAFCPPKEIELNPVIDIVRYVIFPWISRLEKKFEIENLKSGKIKEYSSLSELIDDYKNGNIHPLDLKSSTTNYLIEMLKPARDYFLYGSGKSYLEEIQNLKITR